MRRAPFLATAWASIVAIGACGVDALVLRDLPGADDGGADASSLLDGGARGQAFGAFAGQTFSCALAQGTGFCWGNNVQGALGSGDRQSSLVAVPIVGGAAFDELALGEAHSCGLEHTSGRVMCWGYDANGQLGLGDTASRAMPVVVALPGPASHVTVGYVHSCAVLRDGALYCWGATDEGELGLDDMVGARDALSPTRVGQANDWKYVSAGQGHTCGIRGKGSVYCWGRNTEGELGVGGGMPIQLRAPARAGTFDDFTTLDLGQDDSCGLRADGSLWCWGSPGNGKLTGSPNGPSLEAPTQIGSDTDWIAVSTDVFTTCAIKRSLALYCWGRNVEGQLGVGDTNDRATPTPTGDGRAWASVGVGRFHVCAQTTDHAVYCAGADESGQLGQNDLLRRSRFSPVVLPGVR